MRICENVCTFADQSSAMHIVPSLLSSLECHQHDNETRTIPLTSGHRQQAAFLMQYEGRPAAHAAADAAAEADHVAFHHHQAALHDSSAIFSTFS